MRMTAWVRSLVGCVAWRLNSRLQMGWMAAVFMACVGQPVCADDPVERLGEISGRVTLVGKVPRAKVADSTGQRKLLLQVSRRTRGVRYVVAFLEPHEKRPSGKTREAPLPVITIDQIDHVTDP